MRAVEEQASGERITVRVLFFGAAREIAGRDEVDLSLRAPATAASAFEEIMSRYPELRRFGRVHISVAPVYTGDQDVRAQSQRGLKLFRPVSGVACV